MYASGHPCPMCLAAMRLAGITDIYYAYSNEDGAPYRADLGAALCRSQKALRRTADEVRLSSGPARRARRISTSSGGRCRRAEAAAFQPLLQCRLIQRGKNAKLLLRVWTSLSTPGLLIGILFFAVSLTPSLIPRPYLLQGVLSGCSLAVGYGLGVLGRWLWLYLELPALRPQRRARRQGFGRLVVCSGMAIAFLWQAASWQNSVRELMGLDPVRDAPSR